MPYSKWDEASKKLLSFEWYTLWDKTFIELSYVNFNLPPNNEDRSRKLAEVRKVFPPIDSPQFNRLPEIEKHIAKILYQYTITIMEDHRTNNFSNVSFLAERNRKIINDVPPQFLEVPFIKEISDALIAKHSHLSGEAYKKFSEKQQREMQEIHAKHLQIRENAEKARKDQIVMAAHKKLLNEYIKEYGDTDGKRKYIKALDTHGMHAVLYNKQQDKLDQIKSDLSRLCSQQCVDLISQLKIEFPIAPWEKYLPKEGGSKKSKTRRRRHRN
jgi:DNA mismatch repair ATPase MutS